MKEFYSPKELAEILSIDRKTVLSLIIKGKLLATNMAVGSRNLYRISKQDLDKFINSNKKYARKNSKNTKTN